jgi:hypothetical protein
MQDVCFRDLSKGNMQGVCFRDLSKGNMQGVCFRDLSKGNMQGICLAFRDLSSFGHFFYDTGFFAAFFFRNNLIIAASLEKRCKRDRNLPCPAAHHLIR